MFAYTISPSCFLWSLSQEYFVRKLPETGHDVRSAGPYRGY